MKKIMRIGACGFWLLLLAGCGQPAGPTDAGGEAPFQAADPAADGAPVVADVPVPPPDLNGKKVDPKNIRARVKPVKRLPRTGPDPASEQRHRDLLTLAKAHEMYFAPGAQENLLKHGSFEGDWGKSADYPEGWGAMRDLAKPTFRRAEGYGKVGDVAVRMLGSADSDTGMQTLELPPIEKLRGKEIVFGMWIKAAWPHDTFVEIVDSDVTGHRAQPTVRNEWQLVPVRTRIAGDSTGVTCGISLKKVEGVEALIDGAAFVIIE